MRHNSRLPKKGTSRNRHGLTRAGGQCDLPLLVLFFFFFLLLFPPLPWELRPLVCQGRVFACEWIGVLSDWPADGARKVLSTAQEAGERGVTSFDIRSAREQGDQVKNGACILPSVMEKRKEKQLRTVPRATGTVLLQERPKTPAS